MNTLLRLTAILGAAWIARTTYWFVVLWHASSGKHLETVIRLFGGFGLWAIVSWLSILVIGPVAVVLLWKLRLSGIVIGALLLANAVAVGIVDFVRSGNESGFVELILQTMALVVLLAIAVLRLAGSHRGASDIREDD